ncbi:hypothetical protein B0I35DRAFT_363436 [Stachybotrys elegans]|uniref:Glycoside hydrolase 131 catalytic N-terminal domain-containing protein n=1 Tax=Stachybotrys elegans TaxID=80388 RepID=A0A8K0SD26_9HYPO|nr:hypothetical protein B0I35DRAFT_363436 [Stachybotrys elegans]
MSLFRFTSLLLAAHAAAQKCPLQFDARVPQDFALADFDAPNDVFNSDFVKGKDLVFSEILELSPESTLFDVNTVPLVLTINDDSIFAPSADNVQTGFRRAELMAVSNSGSDDSTIGIKTLHFSLAKDSLRPLNLSHEYQLVFLESADFSTNQFALKTGTILGGNTADPDTLQLFGNINDGQLLFTTPFTDDVIHNFALKLDFEGLTTQVFYSQGAAALEAVTEALPNDVSGQGQFHFGLLKKPTGSTGDITKEGFQPSGINEGVLYGGIFEEDSTGDCISLSPSCNQSQRRRRR